MRSRPYDEQGGSCESQQHPLSCARRPGRCRRRAQLPTLSGSLPAAAARRAYRSRPQRAFDPRQITPDLTGLSPTAPIAAAEKAAKESRGCRLRRRHHRSRHIGLIIAVTALPPHNNAAAWRRCRVAVTVVAIAVAITIIIIVVVIIINRLRPRRRLGVTLIGRALIWRRHRLSRSHAPFLRRWFHRRRFGWRRINVFRSRRRSWNRRSNGSLRRCRTRARQCVRPRFLGNWAL